MPPLITTGKRLYLPKGSRVGLFGGSFNPPHSGHRQLAELALKRLRLDYVVWVVSPQNPLKSSHETADFHQRFQKVTALAEHPRFIVSDLEQHINSRYSWQTIHYLTHSYPQINWIWLLGQDNWLTLHHWQKWSHIISTLPIAVCNRPCEEFHNRFGWGKVGKILRHKRIPDKQSHKLPPLSPYWVFMRGPLNKNQSRLIRRRNNLLVSQ